MSEAVATKRPWVFRAALVLLVAGIACGVLKIVLFAMGKPSISVDYAATYNGQVRPANYDPSGDAAPDYREAFRRLPTVPEGINIIGHLWEYDPTSVECRMLESWLASCEEAIGLLYKAAAKPYLWGRVSSSDPNLPLLLEGFDFDTFGHASQCLRYRAEYLGARGNPAEAFRGIMTGFRMAGQLKNAGRQCLGIGQFVEIITHRAAFDLLAYTNVEATLLGDVQRQLEEILAAGTVPSFHSDGIVLRDIVQRAFTDDGKGHGHVLVQTIHDHFKARKAPKNELGANFAYLRHFWLAWNHPSRRETIQTVDRLTEAASQLIQQTPWELHAKGVNPIERLREIRGQNAFLGITTADAAMAWPIQSHHRNLASTEALIATIGILRFHQDKGTWPASLEELATAGYIRRVPIDPYSGRPLAYRPAKDSFLLYSCGADFDDDGGTRSTWGQDAKGGDQVFWPVGERK